MSDTPYPIDLDSIRGAFPPGIEAPPLLVDFAAWLKGRPWGSVGCFSLQGQFSDSAPIVDGSPLRERFSLFMRLPDGSAVGGWYGAGLDRDNPPIVGLGSEGDYELLAPSLDGLLAKLTSQAFDKAWRDLKPHDEVECQTVELAQWLAERPTGEAAAPDEDASELPDFRGFMEKWSRDREDYWANHRMMAELGWRLAAHLPKGKNAWDNTRFEVAIVGKQYQARILKQGAQPFEEATSIESLLRELREQMWKAQPELGLWYAMRFGLYADGRVMPSFEYDARPTVAGEPAKLSEAQADLARAPRPERWVPKWLTES
ncbi:hypothetical protein ACNJYD_19010 [Bradyrhizobium sp. DASA03005]|uniref:hypothetical protein n=1 Tax=unclassified Bradyrhizobium TaxID=2631580 RepID=UPI0021AAF0A0|nr:hypothetical protein [Bradyrhizobium sp. NC92]UWU65589.1 hypothetical protein N2602_20170 [Bradyrhizobium sp. NC92]